MHSDTGDSNPGLRHSTRLRLEDGTVSWNSQLPPLDVHPGVMRVNWNLLDSGRRNRGRTDIVLLGCAGGSIFNRRRRFVHAPVATLTSASWA